MTTALRVLPRLGEKEEVLKTIWLKHRHFCWHGSTFSQGLKLTMHSPDNRHDLVNSFKRTDTKMRMWGTILSRWGRRSLSSSSNGRPVDGDSLNIRGSLDPTIRASSDKISKADDVAASEESEDGAGDYSSLGRSGSLLDAGADSEGGGDDRRGKESSKSKRKSLSKGTVCKPTPGRDVLYGISPCLLALEAGRRTLSKIYLTANFTLSRRPEALKIMQRIKDDGLGGLVHEVHRADLNRLSCGRPHQGVALETSRLRFEPLPDEDPNGKEYWQDPPVYLGLEQIQDPMNLGAILRSAYYLGVDKVVAWKHNCCSLTPVVSKASSGVMEILPVYANDNLPSYIQKLRSREWEIVGSTCPSSSTHEPASHHPSSPGLITAATDFELRKPTLLIVGGEGTGLSDEIERECTQMLTIPAGRVLHDGVDSLNVSVAVGILLQSILRQRGFRRNGKT